MRPRALAGLLLAAALMATAAGCSPKKKEAPAPKPTATVTVEAAAIRNAPRTLTATGTVAAWQEVPVGAETGGLEAKQVLADENQFVRQGQVLVQLDDAVLRAQLRQAEAGVASAKAQAAQADADLSRSQTLHAQGYLSQAGLDQKVAAQRSAAANVLSAQASQALAAEHVAQAVIRAPVSGLIISRSVVKGQIVSAGTELFRMVRDGRLELNAQVPEAELANVHAGMAATVVSDQAGQAAGAVRIVTPRVDPQTRLGLARIALSAPGAFRPGMFGRATIQLGEQPALSIPAGAAVYKETQVSVFVIANGVAHARAVQAGVRFGDRLEVRSGLNAGEWVAVQGAGFLSDGDHVRVANGRP